MNTADKKQFLELIISNQILRFGEFTLKSGRVSPYFFNAGLFNTGSLLSELAGYYAKCIAANIGGEFVLYGPAYKGIPLAAATAVQLVQNEGRDVPYAFNRKETKDHGEGGLIVGSELKGDVVIIDDVITAGTSVRESVDIIQAAGATVKAVVIAVDRQERAGDDALSAVQSVTQQYGVPVFSIVALDDIVHYANEDEVLQANAQAVRDYQQQYGV
ncbi:MAG: orotate phosphoribosyltransferase [Saprospiraceae bacterium]|jgi:orotate phosphoribosyltransferase